MANDPNNLAIFNRPKLERERYRRAILASAVLGFTFHLLLVSRLTELFPFLGFLRPLALAVIILTSVFGVAMCLDPKRIGAGIAGIAFLLAVPLAVYNFDVRTAQPFVLSSGGYYYGIGLVGLFVAVARLEGGLERFLRIAFWICVAYILIYVVVAPLLAGGYLTLPEDSALLVAEDKTSGRSARVVLASTHAAFVLGVALASLMQRFEWKHLMVVALALVALLLAQSRLITVIILLILIAYFVSRRITLLGILSFIFFLAALSVSMVIAFSDMNPFENFASDQSGWARWQDVEIVHRTIANYWILGAGVAAGEDGYMPFTKVDYFFPGDIGLIGQHFNFGVLGMIVYTAQAYGACFSKATLSAIGVDTRLSTGLALAGIISVCYSILAPVFAGGSATVFGSIFLAILPYAPAIGFWRRRDMGRFGVAVARR
ncbi:hypothetical protein PX699_17705 [Sphingobium sp. H39-3-25]|uniref:hypothetical protein n=1 Tax=Sphingobium arseniciresistens TaxID=3030834 RepID=UPI0023B8A9F6|nr:hypothetical protein [Sphingobium arseniciresistens]